MPRSLRRLTVTLVLLVVSGIVSPSPAQWPPDSTENLQVLPKDIPVRELISLMRGFAGALGVRCIHCHVGDDPNDLSSTDFPSDDRVEKRKAREMIRMVQQINGELLAAVPERSDPPIEVTCVTCHRGVTQPRDVRDILTAVVLAQGADSAIATYQQLRERYYGSASYDFRDFMLANVAEGLAGREPDAALRILEYNIQVHPQSTQSYLTIAQIEVRRGNRDAAIAALEKAATVEPENEFWPRMIARLRGGQ
ncbi:MAG TPA: c-type cytochrome [Gemmatimonadales bacterium]